MKKINVLLVGIGGYGALFVEEILNNTNPLIELAGVVDPFPERCSLLEKLKSENVQIFSDMESFFKENTADLAVISTPIFL
ncbi:MAG: Gfo/Idh/MocA family oxidoreductase, partial [Clostridia bacterium]|nr:Gfo/Idh/MocA family oxidoreductase [Clostridia bacterium]